MDIDRAEDVGSWKLVNTVVGSRTGEGEETERNEEEDGEATEHLDMVSEITVDVRDDSSLLMRGMQQNSSSALDTVEPNRHQNMKMKTLSELWREEKRKVSSSSSSQSHHQKSMKQKSQELSAESHKSPSQRMNEFMKQLCSTATSSSPRPSSYIREPYCIRNPNASGELDTVAAEAHISGSSRIRIRDCPGNEPYSQESRSDLFLGRCKSSTEFALESLRFISKASEVGSDNQWKAVEDRFYQLASTDGLLARADFGCCIGTNIRS